MDSFNALFDFTKVCRLCLSQDCPLSPIYSHQNSGEFSSSLSLKILACVAIQVEPGDNLPDKICNRCIEQLGNWNKFKELCDNANTLLLQYAASIPPLSDEILEKNLLCNNDRQLDIPVIPTDIVDVDVSILDNDLLFQKFEVSKEESLPDTESISGLLNDYYDFEKQNNEQIDEEAKQKLDEEAIENDKLRSKWREKYLNCYAKKYYCALCPRVFRKFSALLIHDKTEHKEITPNDMCTVCGQLFISKLRLEIHVHMKHREKVFECDICGAKSVSEKSLKTHKVKHSERFKCKICGLATITQRNLQEHMSIHSKGEKHVCEVCLESFKQKQSLEHHLKSHTLAREYDFECDVCSRRFKTARYLKSHKLSHGTSSAICDICGAILKNKQTLYVHMLKHKGKQYPCVNCDKTFHRKGLLSRHMLIHSARPYVCEVCDKTYNRPDTLALHLKTHSASQSFSCSHCNQTFTLQRYLKRHFVKIHQTDVDEC